VINSIAAMKTFRIERTLYGLPYVSFIWLFGLLSWGLVFSQVAGIGQYGLVLVKQNALQAAIVLLLLVLSFFVGYRRNRTFSLPSEDALILLVVLAFRSELAVGLMGIAAILNTISRLTDQSLRQQKSSPWYASLGEVFFQGGLMAFVTLTGGTVLSLFYKGNGITSLGLREVEAILTAYVAIVLIRWSISFLHSWSGGIPIVEFTRDLRELRSVPVLLSEIAKVLLVVAMAIVLKWNLLVFVALAGVMVSIIALLGNQTRIAEKLQATIVELQILNSVGRALNNPSQTRKQLLNALYGQSRDLFKADSFALYLYPDNRTAGDSMMPWIVDQDGDENFKPNGNGNGNGNRDKDREPISKAPEEKAIGLAEWCTKNRRTLRIDDVASQATFYGYSWLTRQLPYRSWLGAPLESENRLLGVISIASQSRSAFTEQHQELLRVLGQQVVSALENARLFEMATIDGLTQLLTPRYLRQKLAEEFDRAKKNRKHLGLIMIDIDHFKRINDTYGHEVGNEVLQHLAQVLRSSLRDGDIAARYGGEEFTVLLPGTTMEIAVKVGERLRQAIERSPAITSAGEVKITASLGVAGYPEINTQDQNALVSAADSALYRSKQNGRNQVTAAN
jgi:diguanylate cyclase (GGDEF)-like protein